MLKQMVSALVSVAGPSRLVRPIPYSSLRSTQPQQRYLSITSTSWRQTPSFSRAGPPPLPPAEQAEFEALIKANETVGATPEITKPAEEIEHRDIRRGPRAEFEGDVNPLTGEQGGPKVDPFKAGDGDWQYGGRVTDF